MTLGLATALMVMYEMEVNEMDKYSDLDANDVSCLLQAKLKVLGDGCFGGDHKLLFKSDDQEREWIKNLLSEIDDLIFLNAQKMNR